MVLSNLTLFGQPVFSGLLIQLFAFLLETSGIHISAAHINLIKIPVALEGVITIDVLVGVDELDHPPPQATDLVSDNESDQNESDDLVGIHSNLLRLDSVCSGRLVVVIFDQSFNFGYIKQLDQFRKPHQSEETGQESTLVNYVEREGGHEVDQHPAALKVLLRYFLDVGHPLERFAILVLTNAVEEKVEEKESCYTVVGELVDCARLEPEGNECDRSKARVADDTKD